jgi:hypothetical protein
MPTESKSQNFVIGLSYFLVLALVIPGMVSAAFISYLFGPSLLLSITGGTEFGFTNGLALSILCGIIFTPFGFCSEMLIRRLRNSDWAKRRSFFIWRMFASKAQSDKAMIWQRFTEIIVKGESKGIISWYFFQVWGQFIMHWNIAASLFVLALAYFFDGFLISGNLRLSGPLASLDTKSVVLLFTIVFNFWTSIYFDRWHRKNIDIWSVVRPFGTSRSLVNAEPPIALRSTSATTCRKALRLAATFLAASTSIS